MCARAHPYHATRRTGCFFKTTALRASCRARASKSSGIASCRDQVPAMHNERRRGQRHEHHDHVPARRCGDRPGQHGQVPVRRRRHRPWRRDQALATHTIKYLRGAAGIGLGTTIKYLRRTTSAAANNGLGTTAKYLVNQNASAGNSCAKAHKHKSWARTQMNPPVV
jgi:hypothetical protein